MTGGGGGPVVLPARVGGVSGGVGGANGATSPPTHVCVRQEVVVVGGSRFAFACEQVRWWWCEAVVLVPHHRSLAFVRERSWWYSCLKRVVVEGVGQRHCPLAFGYH